MFNSATDPTVPPLPTPAPDTPLFGVCSVISQDTESGGAHPSIPTMQMMPVQGGGSEPPAAYYELTAEQAAIPAEERTSLNFRSPGPQTTKSSFNRLAAEPVTPA
jgi:hypothetical protein